MLRTASPGCIGVIRTPKGLSEGLVPHDCSAGAAGGGGRMRSERLLCGRLGNSSLESAAGWGRPSPLSPNHHHEIR